MQLSEFGLKTAAKTVKVELVLNAAVAAVFNDKFITPKIFGGGLMQKTAANFVSSCV